MVMTQACDLEHAKVTNVVLCPHYGLNEFKDAWEDDQRNKGQNPTARPGGATAMRSARGPSGTSTS